mmetsp:Transcript_34296/g.74943  ORF Transcript_34296/g.74943 Transcript_34296/m.74943 type:complete len:231 (+) Transcript_34296:225-917(+)
MANWRCHLPPVAVGNEKPPDHRHFQRQWKHSQNPSQAGRSIHRSRLFSCRGQSWNPTVRRVMDLSLVSRHSHVAQRSAQSNDDPYAPGRHRSSHQKQKEALSVRASVAAAARTLGAAGEHRWISHRRCQTEAHFQCSPQVQQRSPGVRAVLASGRSKPMPRIRRSKHCCSHAGMMQRNPAFQLPVRPGTIPSASGSRCVGLPSRSNFCQGCVRRAGAKCISEQGSHTTAL